MPMKGMQSSKEETAPRTDFFLGGIEAASHGATHAGFGGKRGRRGGSERKKKQFPHQIPPQALFPQPPPSSDSTHTPQTHPHLPHLPECSRKGSTQQSQVWGSGTAAVGSFVDKGSNGGPLGAAPDHDSSFQNQRLAGVFLPATVDREQCPGRRQAYDWVGGKVCCSHIPSLLAPPGLEFDQQLICSTHNTISRSPKALFPSFFSTKKRWKKATSSFLLLV